ncbi:ring-cleaving dioxygenase [Muricauda oceani]|uniref:Ring-cleaving dioxygenase n=1 Tax=Flagellimonas oceani TaxID=2698672 RepID=A0A6G7J0M1_9FLAO|nr:ring-cleaving dioxygenase [Allomuricauda oceani]MBW8243641.1 ring-cleaving dioxygenase [Allomuricauda oceani]QII43992.1 ring-cleaving dioxygenase [Allomuricauda oceani]
MDYKVKGLHHVTAIAGNAQRNFDFYTKILGLRLVKKTVNFDDPGTYHFYFGNEKGEPGTLLTFFPWDGITTGRRGTGQATETAFSVPEGSFDFWMERFENENVIYNKPSKRFDEEYLVFIDPDGLKLELVSVAGDNRSPYTTEEIDHTKSIRGLHAVTLTLEGYEKTASILTELFDYEQTHEQVNRFRFESRNVKDAGIIDLVCLPEERRGMVAGGSVHHIAFRVENTAVQQHFRDKLVERGLNVTPEVNRDYFKSIYFREPGGILFEIATDDPGFTVDEPLEKLGTSLKLPQMYEVKRKDIEAILPRIEE